MLAKLVYQNCFKRVSPLLPALMEDMARIRFEFAGQSFNYKNSLDYEIALFLSENIDSIEKSLVSANETEKNSFLKSKEDYKDFKELNNFIAYCQFVYKNVYTVYIKLSSDNSESKMIMGNKETKEEDIVILSHALTLYQKLLNEVDKYPEWRDKVKSEIGTLINLLHSMHSGKEEFGKVFSQFNTENFFK